MLLSLTEYIQYLTNVRKVSAATLDTYQRSLARIGIESIDTSDLASVWSKLNTALDNGVPSGFIANYNSLLGGCLDLHAVEQKSFEYNTFREKLGTRLKHSPIAYTEEQVSLLLKSVRAENKDLYKLIIFLAYSGCRIGGAKGLKLSSFKEVPGFDKVMSVPIFSKGKNYNAIISKLAVNELKFYSYGVDYLFTDWDGKKTEFENYYRSMLAAAIKRLDLVEKLTVETAIFHSVRKFYAVCLVNDSIESDAMTLLLGQTPNTLAWKTYVTAKGASIDQLIPRLAEAYGKTRFVSKELWK